jgi:hypothetical protein
MGNKRYLYVCRGCRRLDFELLEPHCPTCGNDDSALTIDVQRLSCLAHNLAIAGGLCAAFQQGIESDDGFGSRDPEAFYPGHSIPRGTGEG